MVENRIESFAELETAISNLSQLSDKITATLNETNAIYESQDEAWYSANSRKESSKMMNYSEEAQKIAKNVGEVSETVEKFKTKTRNIDEQ